MMSLTTNQRSGTIVAASGVFALGLVLCTIIAAVTLTKIKSEGQAIQVTGAAFKPIRSDYAVWEGVLSVTAPVLEDAYAKLTADLSRTEVFLRDNGFVPEQYQIKSVSIAEKRNAKREFIGYELSQKITVEMADVDSITSLANKASTLIAQGVKMQSRQPSYLFTGLDTLKIEMIRAATENAKLRAEQLAQTTGASVGSPRSARVGVFQIRALHSQDVSSRGVSDVSSIEKEIVSTVHVSFFID